MYRKVLVGYDDTAQSKDALALGEQLAEATGAELVVAGVFQFDPLWGGYDPRFRDTDAEFARSIEGGRQGGWRRAGRFRAARRSAGCMSSPRRSRPI